MTYAEFKKEHDYLVTQIIFTDNNRADTLVERLERLRLDNQKHFNQLWGEL
jgi:nitrogen-specific signal transduction histidine kinase